MKSWKQQETWLITYRESPVGLKADFSVETYSSTQKKNKNKNKQKNKKKKTQNNLKQESYIQQSYLSKMKVK